MKLQRIDKTLFKKTTLTNVGGVILFFHGLTLGNWLSAYRMDCLLCPDPDLTCPSSEKAGMAS